MKKALKSTLFILTFVTALVSCSHQKAQDRAVASKDCSESAKSEYHSYFDSYEMCMEKEPQK